MNEIIVCVIWNKKGNLFPERWINPWLPHHHRLDGNVKMCHWSDYRFLSVYHINPKIGFYEFHRLEIIVYSALVMWSMNSSEYCVSPHRWKESDNVGANESNKLMRIESEANKKTSPLFLIFELLFEFYQIMCQMICLERKKTAPIDCCRM